MAKKIKLSEAAKDLHISAKELAAFLEEHNQGKKNSSSSVTEEEMNLALEYYTQKAGVENFDAYFATRNQPRPEKPAKAEKAKKEQPAQQTKKEQPAQQPKKEQPAQQEKKEQSAQPKKRKEDKKKPKTPQVHGEKTRLGGVIGETREESPEKRRTVDTRGSYVNLEKYNERYEQIAPADRRKDNYSTKKQKINQKSAQKNKKGGRKQETEAQRLSRLELERARKQQLKVRIPDSIQVGELASRLKVTASKVIGKLMGLGVMASINEEVDFDTASLVAEELGAKVEKEVIVTIEERLIESEENDEEA